MTALAEALFSDLVNRPRDTVAKLAASANRSLRLRRRGAEDLVLTTASRYEQDHEVSSATVRFFMAMVKHNDQARELLLHALPEVFPWVRFLPDEDARAFLADLVDTLRAAEAINNSAPVAQLITEWRHTAEVHADPHLREVLSREADDFGPVPPPGPAR
ncbi:MAG: hypothetical protein GEV12_18580 [Micromonosporaceae bacterium]|nr:hypothetical protein [Micromonosporaceae bacterium]